MKHVGAAALSVTVFIVAWSIVAGLLTAGSLMAGGPETTLGKALAGGALVLGPLVGGLVAVYVTGRMVKELSSMRVYLSFVVAGILLTSFFTAPWYLVKDGIGQGTPQQLQAVVLEVLLAIGGGFLGRRLIHRFRAKPPRVTDTPVS